jgi:hypothetical protein
MSNRRTLARRLSAAALLFAACGGSTSTTPADVDGGSTIDGGGRDGAPSADGGKPVGCPADPPGAGASCTRDGLECEYGTDPRHQCREVATCSSGKWEVMAPKCAQIPPTTCPASRAAASGKECSPEAAICVYEDALKCSCTTCPNPYPICQTLPKPIWSCEAPNEDAACPPARPNFGTTCSQEQKECSYGCEPDNNLICTGGVWQRNPDLKFACAASTRRVKKAVRYVTSSERASLAHEVDAIKLATYEYTDPGLAGGRHLGFIIEDRATTYAADAERNQVDLYAYTSTLVAAVQEQAKRIDALERELRTVRATKAR